MTRPLTVLLLTLIGLSLATPAARADRIYLSFYDVEPGSDEPYRVFKVTQEVFENQFQLAKDAGLRLVDVEVYRRIGGDVLYDAVFYPGDYGTELHTGLSAANLPIVADTGNNRKVSDLTSYEQDGERVYTMVLRSQGFAQNQEIALGMTEAEYDDWVANLPEGPGVTVWPEVYETWYDADGVRRIDAVANRPWTNDLDWAVFDDLTVSEFVLKVEEMEQQGLTLRNFESWLDLDGETRMHALFAGNFASDWVFHVDEGFAAFEANLLAETTGGPRELIDFAVLVDRTTATAQSYGTGLAGTFGVPSLGVSAQPYLGTNIDLQVGNSAGFSTLVGLVAGAASISAPFKGGQLLVDPLLILPVGIGPGGSDLAITMPSDPLLDGLSLFVQTLVSDPGAPNGFALSPGLELLMGRLD